jgi:hypothetical protein
MSRQGSGWVVSTYDPAVRCQRVSGEQTFWAARSGLSLWRLGRALTLLGLDAEQGYNALARDPAEGSVRDRLDAILDVGV